MFAEQLFNRFKMTANLNAAARLLVVLLSALTPARMLAQPEGLMVTAAFAGRELSPQDAIELRLNRPLTAEDGKPSVFIGSTDVSDLITVSRAHIQYRPQPLPLPPGETEVTMWLVSGEGEWKKLGSFPLRVGAPAVVTPGAQTANDAPLAPMTEVQEAAKRPAFLITPKLKLGLKSQPAETHYATVPGPSGRSTFTDFTLQAGLGASVERGLFGLQSQFDVVGSSYRPEALRYALLGDKAPRIDLTGYSTKLHFGKTQLSAGSVSHGRERHLINEFASRGLSLSRPLSDRADVSVAAQNGTSIVGWDNFFGLNRRDHQIVSGTFGYDLLAKQPDRPSAKLRVEASVLSGSVLPLSNFNQGKVADAEKSRGGSLRVLAADAAERFHLDAGWARSRSFNPADPLLAQGNPTVGVRETTNDAHYLDVSYALLQNRALTADTKVNLQVSYQHERVAPLFRSVATDVQPNKLLNQIGLAGNVGEVSVNFSHLRFNDNLDNIPSLLKTMTRRNLLTVGLPARVLFGKRGVAADQASGRSPAWMPQLGYTYDRTHQFGAGLPPNSEFKLAQVPDQVGTHQTFTAEWQSAHWRYGYKLDHSAQDNFGEKRADTKMRNLVHGLTLGFAPHNAFGINFELSRELSHSQDNNANKDPERNDHTRRYALSANWRPTRATAMTMNLSNSSMHGFGAITRADARRSTQFDWQWSWRFLGREESGPSPGVKPGLKPKGQFFVRYSHRSAYTRSELLMQNVINRGHTLNTGVNFTFF